MDCQRLKDFDYTINDFKKWAARQTGFDFQPAPGWVKTTYEIDDVVNYNGKTYTSLISNNYTNPEEGSLLENPSWKIQDEYDEKALEWVKPISYNTGDRVIAMDETTFKFFLYQSAIDNNYDDPTTATETQTSSDADLSGIILDSEIEEAMGEALMKFNSNAFPCKAERNIAFSLLTAFFLVYDRQMSASGTNSGYTGLPTSKKIGEMSISYMADPLISQNSPSYAFFARNAYGLKYYNMVRSRTKGPFIAIGRTTNI